MASSTAAGSPLLSSKLSTTETEGGVPPAPLLPASYYSFPNTFVRLPDDSYFSIHTNREGRAYTAGEAIDGEVRAFIASPQTCDKIIVVLTCKETATFEDERISHYREPEGRGAPIPVYDHDVRTLSNKLFKIQLLVASPGVLPAGSYTWKFRFNLHATNPGSIKFFGSTPSQDPVWVRHERPLFCQSKLAYNLRVRAEVGGRFREDIDARQEVLVHQSVDESLLSPQNYEQEEKVVSCMCLNRGTISMKAGLPKLVYTAGDTIIPTGAFENHSSKDVWDVKLSLYRAVTVTDNEGCERVFSSTVVEKSYTGIPAGRSVRYTYPVPLTGEQGTFVPTTTSTHLSVGYTLHLHCGMPKGAPELGTHIPIIIFGGMRY